MKKSRGDATTAKNLEDKFNRGEDVLGYFDASKARVVDPQSKGATVKAKVAYPVKRNAKRPVAVREQSARYRKK